MTRTRWTELKGQKLGAMTADERAEYERAYAEAQLAAKVGGVTLESSPVELIPAIRYETGN